MKIVQAPLLNPFIPLMWSAFLLFSCSTEHADIKISGELAPPPVQFALQELTSAIQKVGKEVLLMENSQNKADITFVIQPDDERLQAEGFSIEKAGATIKVIGADVAGAMYGGMELAEQIRLFGLAGVEATLQNPYMERRGTKFNIPLDMRSPSYSDASDAAQQNIPNMWDFSFWQGYIDNLARYRYNFISLWSLHPFPSMVKVPDYPDIALQDVQRSTVDWQEYYHLHGTGLDAPDILANPETVKQMSIEEKMAFWQKVMKYGKDHNVDFYVVTWNIFVNGTEGQYGITDAIDNPITRDYFRKSVKQMFVTYPDLAGIGLTTGENMGGAGFEEKEDWAFETYAQGVLDAAEEMPDRHFTFIHRQHQAGALAIAEKFKPLRDRDNIEFLFSFKYAAAHVFSATQQHFHQKFVEDIKGMKTIWTLRNDDVYHFRWGAPDFVREFISNIPHEVSRGMYYGSDQWVWGREFLMKDPETPRQLEIVKHWYHWMLWGRLGYNPQLSNERFIQILQDHYPDVAAEKLFAAWQDASMIYPITTGFHWGPLDFQWYIEACKSRPAYAQNETGFHDVNRFISLPPHPKSGFQSIPDFVAMTTSNGSSELTSPLAVATQLQATADKALLNLETLAAGENKALQATLQDIRTMAYLGKYYAHKITGATQLALYRKTKDQTYQDQALSELTQALDYWEKYTAAAMTQNINPLWTNRVGYVDWIQITEWVKGDIEIAKAG